MREYSEKIKEMEQEQKGRRRAARNRVAMLEAKTVCTMQKNAKK
jgi:hypothetical protein